LFTEPQFPPALASRLAEGTTLRIAQLDPLGADLAPGPDNHFALMENLVRDLVACLGR
jgi:zinc transport system substrate-binding protein